MCFFIFLFFLRIPNIYIMEVGTLYQKLKETTETTETTTSSNNAPENSYSVRQRFTRYYKARCPYDGEFSQVQE